MSATLTMPRLGETMEEGRIVAWLVAPGATFARGDALIEVETDKTVVEFPALGGGTLTETLVEAGDMVKVGAPIAKVEIADGPDWTRDGDAAPAGDDGAESAVSAEPAQPAPAPAPAPAPTGGPLRATPLARRIARDRGIDLSAIDGTGRRGRVERADVERSTPAGDGDPAALTAADLTAPVPKFGGIAYAAEGPRDGAPVLLIHGYSGDHIGFAALVSGLNKAGRFTVAVDLPSHGQTERDAASLDALGQGLPELARHLFGSRRPHIVSHSMGAIPATALAETLDATALSMISPAGLGLKIDGEFLDGMADAQSVGEVEHLLRRISEAPLPLSQEILGLVFAELKRGRLRALADALHTGGKQKVSIRGKIAKLAETIPVSILVGARDRIVDSADALDVSPRIAVHHFPRAGHVPHWEAPAEALDIILAKGA